ncbi:MAG: RNA methyltransferase [Acidobacteria bacterium]|nr:RNA methyltransferase [Acidobacteriota bacterium]
MSIIRIDDGHDPRLADYAGVREPARLRDRGLFIAEGRFVVRRLLGIRRITMKSLLLNDAALNALADAIDHANPSPDVYVASPDVIEAATGFNMHRGCLALAERPADVLIDAVLSTSEFVVVLERVADPDNVGSVFRSAEAFGVDAVLVSPGCCDPFYRKAIRTSSGALLVVPCAAAAPWPDALDRLRASGFVVAALTPEVSAIDIGVFVGTADARGRLAVVLGTEGHGLTAEALARADVQLRIPMAGEIDSLNIATAAGIALHRLHECRRRE